MPCLFRYRWLKLPRAALPQGKGLSAYWARLAARAAFRKGVASYCGHENPVEPGMWSGGVVGLKSILGVKKRERALEILEQLSSHGYLSYELNPETKQLSYRITDWEMDHCGSECESRNVYTTPGYGFLCVPRHPGTYTPPPVMAFTVCRDGSLRGCCLYNTINTKNPTHFLIFGATRYPWTPEMRFLFLLRFVNTANTEFF